MASPQLGDALQFLPKDQSSSADHSAADVMARCVKAKLSPKAEGVGSTLKLSDAEGRDEARSSKDPPPPWTNHVAGETVYGPLTGEHFLVNSYGQFQFGVSMARADRTCGATFCGSTQCSGACSEIGDDSTARRSRQNLGAD